MIGAEFAVATDLGQTLKGVRKRVESAAQTGVYATINYAERYAKAQHESLSGWKNESGMLEATITGYVAGDQKEGRFVGLENDKVGGIYAYERRAARLKPRAPFRRGGRLVRSQKYLDDHYKVWRSVSPPIAPIDGKIIGVLHHYMKYSNRLPFATGKEDISVAALKANRAFLERMLVEWTAKALDR